MGRRMTSLVVTHTTKLRDETSFIKAVVRSLPCPPPTTLQASRQWRGNKRAAAVTCTPSIAGTCAAPVRL
ncbi:hypothetical protein E2C01_101837 [Portunus trituberculatus]|uniref:Uncharacterized protein n=1 Tax=Portunus trituberculatus TaxID=210409 RepID=A0A5B7KGX1_PORTR|nr:hypothetical protein [Portunus trituberculatus]